jgi:hypothetical protein
MHTVRIIVEDKATKTLHWYASYECDASELELEVNPGEVICASKGADNILTTFSTSVSLIDLACELYKTYVDSSGVGVEWNKLPADLRKNWIAVAQRIAGLGPLYCAPTRSSLHDIAEVLAGAFDTSDIDLGSGEG